MIVASPLAGTSRTRLVPALDRGAERALGACFIADTLTLARGVARSRGLGITVAHAADAPTMRAIAGDGVALVEQGDGDLGERLRSVAEDVLARTPSVVLLGSDAPTLPAAYVEACLDHLARGGDRIAIGPATDGGAYLLGLTRPHPELFADIDRNAPRVLEQTLAAARRAGVEPLLLAPWYGVGDARSFSVLVADLERGEAASGCRAPATRGFVGWHGLSSRRGGRVSDAPTSLRRVRCPA